MRSFFSSLYGRISLLFLALLLLLSLAQLWVGVVTARNFSRESDQSLNRNLAADLVRTFQPALREGLVADVVANHIQQLMIYNPRVEIYLLDAHGAVQSYFTGGVPLARERVRLEPLQRFLSPGQASALPIYGDDPRSPAGSKPFSAAPIRIGAEPGYVYLILGGEHYESIAAMAEQSYIIRNALLYLLGSFLLIGLVGLSFFFLLTKRLRATARAVRNFQQTRQPTPLPEWPMDEIGEVARAFNEMSAQVQAHLEELRHSDAQRRELVANVSHDLHSPLSSMQGYLETLLMKGPSLAPEEQRRFLEIIHGNVVRLSRLVRELFELSKLESREVQPHLEPFSLTELVQDVVVKFQPQALEKGILLAGEFSPRVPAVMGDIGMIERVLSNLIDNALRYTPPEGRVTVVLEHEGQPESTGGRPPLIGERVSVRVADTGPGIPAEDVPRIFDRFYRVDRARSNDSGGAGIGLAIVKHILAAHHSAVAVQSSSPAGTVIGFSLAAQAARQPAALR